MTREVAIDLLDNLLGMVTDNREADYDEAIKMAIKSLSQMNDIKAIINNPVYIQEDVLRYQMICEVVKE